MPRLLLHSRMCHFYLSLSLSFSLSLPSLFLFLPPLSLLFSVDITDLLSLCSLSSLCTSSLTEGLKLFLKILELTNKEPNDHLSVLCGQVREREILMLSLKLKLTLTKLELLLNSIFKTCKFLEESIDYNNNSPWFFKKSSSDITPDFYYIF